MTDIVLITGLSGSGKSIALHALEDEGFYCVDNLPPELLVQLVEVEQRFNVPRLAIAMDARSATSLHLVPQQIEVLRAGGASVRVVFLEASTDTLVRRFSETRRKHPLSQADALHANAEPQRALVDAIDSERTLLADLRALGYVVDTSIIRTAQLQSTVKSLVTTRSQQLTLVFTSFAFKRGVPLDADYVFDVRMLPNPHYEAELRRLTGLDAAVANYLQRQPEVARMQKHITTFLDDWLPALVTDHRSYVTVGIGCTGGQHRSVYLVEALAAHFATHWPTLKRHRELDAR
ncbi:RNase adapter RapZ [Curvibacter sp. APW13]|uniref:RNase adapter RapZ n=1 Tax=Curvibacter sp. APW13 TaxID=3077236 RepID=UPI0028DEEFA4|nr:RNase adapter RapZ [Curvibacter sp. APW13]MDT8992458.1 RNase adapter RapZ [Curvibacter sp. APW13]